MPERVGDDPDAMSSLGKNRLDELGLLARAFTNMVLNLHKQILDTKEKTGIAERSINEALGARVQVEAREEEIQEISTQLITNANKYSDTMRSVVATTESLTDQIGQIEAGANDQFPQLRTNHSIDEMN